jgi:hypothetical protein
MLGPEQPDHLDRLLERLHRLARRSPRATEVGDHVGEGARPQGELEAAAAEDVERRGRPRHHRGRAQRQVGDVGEERDPARLGEQGREQRPGVEEVALVGVILDPDQVEPGLVGRPHLIADRAEPLGQRDDRDPESEGGLSVAGRHRS